MNTNLHYKVGQRVQYEHREWLIERKRDCGSTLDLTRYICSEGRRQTVSVDARNAKPV